MFSSNHARLIAACYPAPVPAAAATPTNAGSTSTLSSIHADSNALSKLTFYASTRPKKLPVVMQSLLTIAARELKSGEKGRSALAVTLEIARGLVVECRAELECCAMDALKLCEMGLVEQQHEQELVARACGIFHAVATVVTGPLLTLDHALTKQYMTCLQLIASLAQSRDDRLEIKRISLLALEVTSSTDFLYAAAADYRAQIALIIPALLHHLVSTSAENWVQDHTSAPPRLGPASSRRPAVITTSSPDHPTHQAMLAASAIKSLHCLFHLASNAQLLALMDESVEWIDSYSARNLWKSAVQEGEGDTFAESYALAVLAWTAEGSRSLIVHFFSERVLLSISSSDSATRSSTSSRSSSSAPSIKAFKLVEILIHLLRSEIPILALGAGTVLGHLTSVLVRRSARGLEDDYALLIVRAIVQLGQRCPTQINDIVGDLIEAIKSVRVGGGGFVAGDMVGEMTSAAKVRAVKVILRVMKEVVKERRSAGGALRPKVISRATITNTNGVTKDHHRSSTITTTKQYAQYDVERETIKDSFFLLADPSTTLRLEYARFLLFYLSEQRSAAATSLSDSSDPASFFTSFYAALYHLATTTALTSSPSPTSGRSISRAASRRSTHSTRRMSTTSLRSLSSSSERATPLDFALMAELLPAALSLEEGDALLKGVPVLLHMERVVRAEEEDDDDDDGFGEEGVAAQRRKAMREIVANGVSAIGLAWKCERIERMGEEMMMSLAPSVLPDVERSRNEFQDYVDCQSMHLDAFSIIEELSRSSQVQHATDMSYEHLKAALGAGWTPEMNKQAIPMIYRPLASQSISNLSLSRGLHHPSSLGSHRSGSRMTSLADLQNSLVGGRRSSSSLSSSTSASVRSAASRAGYAGDRRSQRMGANGVLEGLNSRMSVVL